jgi:hypothetical protein
VFYFFSDLHFFKIILPAAEMSQLVPTWRDFVLPDIPIAIGSDPSPKPKDPFLCQRTAKNDVSYRKYQVYPDNYTIKYNFSKQKDNEVLPIVRTTFFHFLSD